MRSGARPLRRGRAAGALRTACAARRPNAVTIASSRSDCLTGFVSCARMRRCRAPGAADGEPAGGQHDDLGAASRASARSGAAEREAVDVRHQRIGQHEVETARPASRASSSAASAARGAVDGGRLHPPAGEHLLQDACGWWRCRRRPATRRSCRSSADGRRWLRAAAGCTPKAATEVELAAAARLALDPDRARPSSRPAAPRSSGPARCRRNGASSTRRPARTRRRSATACPAECRCRCRETVNRRTRLVVRSTRSTCDLDDDFAGCSVNLMALPTRLRRTCRSRPGSPTSASGTSGSDVAGELEPLLVRAQREQLARRPRRRRGGRTAPCSSSSRRASIFEKSRMSLRMREQRLGRVVDGPHVLALLRREPRVRARDRSCR